MSAWGGLWGGLGSMIGSGISAAASAKIARDNRKWQERMTKHRYQYQMQDMRAAGLNPMLAFGASPPSTPTPAMPNIPDFGSSLAKGASAAAQVYAQRKQAEKTDAEIPVLNAQADVMQTQSKLNTAKAVTEAELQQTQRDQRFRWGFMNALDAQNSAAQVMRNKGLKLEAEVDETLWGEIMRNVSRGTKGISPFIRAR